MGLDTFAIRPSGKNEKGEPTYETAPSEPFEGINLCGGLCSGGSGSSSFRGKVYAGLVREVTGVDLYQEMIQPEVVQQMADKLSRRETILRVSDSEEEIEAISNLAKWFRVAADNKFIVHGWW